MAKRHPTRKPIARTCHVYVPACFDPIKHLPAPLHKHADSARYILHRIIWGNATKKRTLKDFVPLKFDYLREVIPDRIIKPLKLALQGSDVIECDGHYEEHRKSLGYKLGPECSTSPIVRVSLTNTTINKRVMANRRSEYKKVRLDVHRYLRTQLRSLEIDEEHALKIINDHEHCEVVKLPIQQIAQKECSFSVCRYGRVHTDLTRCTKKVRPCLHVKGERLVEIDIANSQPLFLALVLINYRKHGNTMYNVGTFEAPRSNPYRDIDDIIQETVSCNSQEEVLTAAPTVLLAYTTRKASNKETERQQPPSLTTTAQCPQQLPANRTTFLKADEERFVSLCEQGQLYEELMERAELPIRPWVKEQFFEVVFGKNSTQSAFKADFEELFPNVTAVIRALKRKDYRFLPQLMQNIEANFMINTVCRRLMNEIPEAPVFTIHDSILTTSQFADAIEQTMQQEFSRWGLTPTLRITRHGEKAK